MRNERIDGLRFTGLALIILAHANLPVLVRQLRNFDVPLMVMVSGMSFGLSSAAGSYGSYVWKRVERLLVPSWIFAAAYFCANALLSLAFGYSLSPLTARSIQADFLLRDQSFFWVIRVFLLVALAAPFVARLSRGLPDSRKYLAVLVLAYAGYEVARLGLWPDLGGAWAGPFTEWVLYAVPYAFVFAVGLRIDTMPRPLVAGISAVSFALFAVAAVALSPAGFVPTQQLKYPPSAYYIVYGLGVAALLALIPERYWAPLSSGTPAARAVLFAGRNSLWVYLWHIVFAEVVQTGWALKAVTVLVLSIAVTFAQVRIVTRVVLPRLGSTRVKAHVLRIFTG